MASKTNVTIPQYASQMGVAVPGMLFGDSDHVVLTKKAGEDIGFGSALFATSADGNAVVAEDSTKALALVGVAGFTQKEDGCYVVNDTVSCVKKGFIYIVVTGTIAENEAVYVKYADGSFVSKTTADAGTSGDYVALGAVALNAGTTYDTGKVIVPVLLG